MAKSKIVFIAGCQRSGSTLLGDALGATPIFTHVGELHHVWHRGLLLNWLCGCGSPFRDCAFWGRVMTPWAGEPLEQAEELERTRLRMVREMTSVKWCHEVCRDWPNYVDELRRLISQVYDASSAGVVIDSSKSFRQACMLLATEAVDLDVVHLVRDPRSTVFSLVHRTKRHLDDPDRGSMAALSPEAAIDLWLHSNTQAEQLATLPGVRYMRLRYEDFVAAPSDTLTLIARFTGKSADDQGSSESLLIPPSHTISGNPGRLDRTRSRMISHPSRPDSLEPSLKKLVVSRTGALLQRYGYSLLSDTP